MFHSNSYTYSEQNENTRIHLSESGIQGHLKRIIDYISIGEGHWWTREGDWLVFYDGDDEPNELTDGPELWDLSKTLCDVDIHLERIWKELGKELMPLFNLKAGIINL